MQVLSMSTEIPANLYHPAVLPCVGQNVSIMWHKANGEPFIFISDVPHLLQLCKCRWRLFECCGIWSWTQHLLESGAVFWVQWPLEKACGELLHHQYSFSIINKLFSKKPHLQGYFCGGGKGNKGLQLREPLLVRQTCCQKNPPPKPHPNK